MVLIKNGFVDAEVTPGTDIKYEIERMRKQKNAIILAHYYQEGAIQDLADFVGDSLGLAQQAAKTKADIIVLLAYILWQKRLKFFVPRRKCSSPTSWQDALWLIHALQRISKHLLKIIRIAQLFRT